MVGVCGPTEGVEDSVRAEVCIVVDVEQPTVVMMD